MTRWSRLAGVYDLQLPLERAALRAAADLADPASADRVLDLATGTGGFLRELAARRRVPAEAVGIDASAAMLRRVPTLPEGWRLIQAPAERVPLADQSFDVVAAAFLMHLLDPALRRKVLGEAHRLLRPGGRFLVVTVAPPRSPPLRLLATPLLALARRSDGVLAGLRPLDPTPDLAQAGFTVRETRRTGRGYPSLVVLAVRPEPDAAPSSSSLRQGPE